MGKRAGNVWEGCGVCNNDRTRGGITEPQSGKDFSIIPFPPAMGRDQAPSSLSSWNVTVEITVRV